MPKSCFGLDGYDPDDDSLHEFWEGYRERERAEQERCDFRWQDSDGHTQQCRSPFGHEGYHA